MCNDRAAMRMADRASSRWRSIRQSEAIKGSINVAKKRKAKKPKIKRKRTAKKNKPEKLYDPKVDVLKPDVSDAALEREGALSFTRYGCP